jgi:fatty-acyl-CoA synthase
VSLRGQLPSVEHVVVKTDRAHMAEVAYPGAPCLEDLIAADARWGGFDENTAAGLCYTSGTTDAPGSGLRPERPRAPSASGPDAKGQFRLLAVT